MTENAEEKKTPAESEPTKPAEGAQAPPAEGAAGAEATAAEKEEKIEGLDVDVKQTGPCKIEVKVRVPIEAIKKESAKAFDELSMNATIPGFRKGHAPRKLVERHYQEAVLDDVKRLMTARSWQQVTKEHDIKPIGEPDLADDKIQYDAEKGLSYELALEVMPVFDVKDYKGLDLAQPSTEVTGEEVEKTLENLRKRNAVLEPVEGGTTKQDDVPVVDCDIKAGAQVVQSVSDQEISLNPDNWLRGLDEELWKDLLGKKAGESATKTVTLPKTYAKEEFREKEAQVTVTIKDIKRPKMPELNDDFAKDMLYGNLEDLKKDIRERLSANKEREGRQELERQAEEKLLAMAQFALPEELVKSMAENTANRQRLSLAYQGVPRDELEKAAPVIAESAQKKTERDIRIYFILQQIAGKEEIEVSENEVERRINLMAQMENQKPARYREQLRTEGRLNLVRAELRDEKTMARILSLAVIKDAQGNVIEKKKKKEDAKAEGAAE